MNHTPGDHGDRDDRDEPPAQPPVYGDEEYISVDAGDLPTVMHAQSEFETEAIRAVLRDAGIRSVVVPCGSNVFGFPMGAGGRGIPIKVLADDLSRAREVLSRARFVGRSVDWDDVDVGEMPPDVRAVLERGAGPRRAGGVLVFLGALVAVATGVLVLGGLMMLAWQWVRGARGFLMTGGLQAALVLGGAGGVALTAGCAYTLEGRAVEGHGTIDVTGADGADMLGKPVAGVRVEVIRDPHNSNRVTAGTATSGKDGRFTLTIDGFGAGWMHEEWVLRASRSGYQNVETQMSLPASTNGRLLVVGVARGRSERFRDPESSQSILDEARKFDSGVGTMQR